MGKQQLAASKMYFTLSSVNMNKQPKQSPSLNTFLVWD